MTYKIFKSIKYIPEKMNFETQEVEVAHVLVRTIEQNDLISPTCAYGEVYQLFCVDNVQKIIDQLNNILCKEENRTIIISKSGE